MLTSTEIALLAQDFSVRPSHTSRLNHALLLLERATGSNTIEEVAVAVRMSSSRLRHLVKDRTGMSPTRFIRDARLKNARKLLITSSLLVKQVMWEAGFTDLSHFVRDYKKTFGETPSETRNRALAELFASLSKEEQVSADVDTEIGDVSHLAARLSTISSGSPDERATA